MSTTFALPLGYFSFVVHHPIHSFFRLGKSYITLFVLLFDIVFSVVRGLLYLVYLLGN